MSVVSVERKPAMSSMLVVAIGIAAAVGLGMTAGRSPGTALLAAFAALGFFVSVERPDIAVLALAAYLPFEGWILKFVPDGSLLVLLPELISIGLVLSLALRAALSGSVAAFRHRPLVWIIAGLTAVTLISAMANSTPVMDEINSVRVMLRFAPIALIASLDPWSSSIRRGLPRVAFIVALVQVCIGIVEWRGGIEAARFFWAGNFTIGTVGTQADTLSTVQDRIVAGTMSHYNIYALSLVFWLGVMVIDLLITANANRGWKFAPWVVVAGSVLAVLLSQSRQSVVALLVAASSLGVFIWLRQSPRDSRVPLAFLLVVALSVFTLTSGRFSVGDRFNQLMQPGYWAEQATRDRGYAVTAVVPRVLSETPLFGAGPGAFQTVTKNADTAAGVSRFDLDPARAKYVGDVGWALIATQGGLLSVTAVVCVLWLLFSAGRLARDLTGALYWWFASAFVVGMSASMPLIYKPPSILLWIVVGLAAHTKYRYRLADDSEAEGSIGCLRKV